MVMLIPLGFLAAGSVLHLNASHVHANGHDTRAHLEFGFTFFPKGYQPMYKRSGVLLGNGNGTPWNREMRDPGDGDNLFVASVVAVDPDTGEYSAPMASRPWRWMMPRSRAPMSSRAKSQLTGWKLPSGWRCKGNCRRSSCC